MWEHGTAVQYTQGTPLLLLELELELIRDRFHPLRAVPRLSYAFYCSDLKNNSRLLHLWERGPTLSLERLYTTRNNSRFENSAYRENLGISVLQTVCDLKIDAARFRLSFSKLYFT
jgi:hypothetical protein